MALALAIRTTDVPSPERRADLAERLRALEARQADLGEYIASAVFSSNRDEGSLAAARREIRQLESSIGELADALFTIDEANRKLSQEQAASDLAQANAERDKLEAEFVALVPKVRKLFEAAIPPNERLNAIIGEIEQLRLEQQRQASRIGFTGAFFDPAPSCYGVPVTQAQFTEWIARAEKAIHAIEEG